MRSSETIVLVPVSAPPEWHSFRIGVSFPADPGAREWLLALVFRLVGHLRMSQHLEPTLWLDTQEMHQDGGSKIFSKHARAWSPTMGFAFDPTGPAPRPLEMSDLMDVTYGTPPKIFTRSAIYVSSVRETMPAYSLLAGRGLSTLLLFPLGGVADASTFANAFISKSCEVLQPLMHDGSFQNYDFYFPLLSSKSLENLDAASLNSWLGGTELYLREGLEEKELFLLARFDLAPIFEAMGMRRLSTGNEPLPWELPIEHLLNPAP